MSLPKPSTDALAHQNKLFDHLTARMTQNGGSITFADFMQQALYAPGLGYYSAGCVKFGADGDFVTAPMISPLFSYCLANQCVEILSALDAPNAVILELGAGTGQMAADLLQTLSKQDQLPSEYWILEVSGDLRAKQQTLLKASLPNYYQNIRWLEQLPEKSFNGIILGNEVLDAMPVNLFQIGKDGILEGLVQQSNAAQIFELTFDTPQTTSLASAVKALQQDLHEPLPVGYTSEINLALTPWIKSLSECLNKGVMLFIDYGFPQHEYYHPARHEGTLMCHYRHHAHADPLQYIGLQDITAHVDFTAVANAADKADLAVLGFTQQAAFLMNTGLLDLAENLPNQNPYALSQQIQTLTQPHEMGELFKVMALGKKMDCPLQGFSDFDSRHRL